MEYSYNRLWKLLIDKDMTKTEMRKKAGLSTNILAKMGKGEPIAMDSLSKISQVLNCGFDDIVEVKNESDPISNHVPHKVISLFSGAGGMDIGFENAGFSIAVAVEADPSCCATLRANRPDLPIINKDIVDVSSNEILSAAKMNVLDAALVIGGPPCQSFSLAGLRKGLNDKRGTLIFEFVRIVRETLPTGFVFENVKGLANWDRGNALQMLITALSQPIEYEGNTYTYTIAKPQVLNAVDYGVPQFRERLIIVGNRKGMEFHYPPPMPGNARKTVRDAIGNLPKPEEPSETAKAVAKTIKGRREKYGY